MLSQREFQKEGSTWLAQRLVLHLPYVTARGKSGFEEILADRFILKSEADAKALLTNTNYEMNLVFTLREYNGQLYQQCKIIKISQSV